MIPIFMKTWYWRNKYRQLLTVLRITIGDIEDGASWTDDDAYMYNMSEYTRGYWAGWARAHRNDAKMLKDILESVDE